jgi:hypothetical protein
MASTPKTSRHDGIGLEVAAEKPEVGIDIQFGNDFAFAVLAAFVGDAGYAIHHQHVGEREAGIARAEHGAMGAGEQVVTTEGRWGASEVANPCSKPSG